MHGSAVPRSGVTTCFVKQWIERHKSLSDTGRSGGGSGVSQKSLAAGVLEDFCAVRRGRRGEIVAVEGNAETDAENRRKSTVENYGPSA